MAAVATEIDSGNLFATSNTVSGWTCDAGDVLIFSVLMNGSITSGPSGWTLGQNLSILGGSGAHAWWWKIADGSETSLTYGVSIDQGSLYWLGKIAGLDGADPFDAANGQGTSGGSTYTTPTVSTSAGDKLGLAFMSDAKSGTTASMSGWTNSFVELADFDGDTDNPPGGYVFNMGVATREFTGGGTTSTGVNFSSGATRLARTGIMTVWNVANEGGGEDVTAPSVPTGLTLVTAATNYATVSWSPSTDDTAVTGYDVRVDGGTPIPVTGTSRTIGGLSPSTEYDIEVRAKDAAGNLSAWSTALPVTTAAEGLAPSWRALAVEVLDDGHNGVQEVTTLDGWTCGEDDFLMLVCMTDDVLLDSPAVQPTDAGWTLLWSYEDPGTGATHVVWYKVADGSETSVTFSVRHEIDEPPDAPVEHSGTVYQLLRIEGVDPAAPIDTYDAQTDIGTADSGAITYSTPTLTLSSGQKLAVAALLDFKQTDGDPSTISGWGNSFSEISDVYGVPSIGSAYMMNQAVAVREMAGDTTVSTSANFLASPLRLGASGFIAALNGIADGAPGTSLPYPAGIVGKHFVDQFGDPILYRMDVSWRLQLRDSGTVWEDYFTNRHAKGFNVVEVSIGPSLEGVPPNTDTGVVYDDGGGGLWDVSAAWLTSLRSMADVARTHGITLAIAVGYDWGFSSGERATYVGKIATAFADCPSVTWVFGVDWSQPFWSGANAEVLQVKDDMRAAGLDQPMTVLLDKHYTTSDNAALAGEFDYESVYGYEAQYDLVAHAYSVGTGPVVLGESNFEGENNEQGPATTNETLRRQALWTMTRGGVGWDYGHQKIWRQDSGWESFLNTPVHAQLTAIQRAFEAVDWWKLVPDTGNTFLTSGAGTRPTSGSQVEAYVDPLESTYATAARAADGSLAVVYVPTGRTFGVDLSRLGSGRTVYRVDPTSGATTVLATASSYGSPGANSAGQSDWLYVFQADPIVASGPKVVVNGVEQMAAWSLLVNGVETPVTSWARAVDGVETPLA